jgi:hypothetical protein
MVRHVCFNIVAEHKFTVLSIRIRHPLLKVGSKTYKKTEIAIHGTQNKLFWTLLFLVISFGPGNLKLQGKPGKARISMSRETIRF